MTLVGPDGTRVVLFNRRGGSGNDFANTVFDDEAPNSIWRGTAPFAGSYKPEYVLSAFDGKSAKGTWSLVVDDLFPLDSGKLWAWSMTVDANPAATRRRRPPAPRFAGGPAGRRTGRSPSAGWRRCSSNCDPWATGSGPSTCLPERATSIDRRSVPAGLFA